MTFLEAAVYYMKDYAHDLMTYQFAYSIQTTFTRDVYYALVAKFVDDEKNAEKFLKLYDLSE